jgi:hypothetical protein
VKRLKRFCSIAKNRILWGLRVLYEISLYGITAMMA